jgi:CoA:oxalate CoA-transferase
VLSVPEITRHPHVAARGVVQQIHVPALDRDVRVVGAGFQLAGQQVPIESPPPILGEHTADILHRLGYDDTEVERLRADGVI